MENDTPARPWLIYIDDELYGDWKTKPDRDKALPEAVEYANEAGGELPLSEWLPDGRYDWENDIHHGRCWSPLRPAPQHEHQPEAG